MVIRSGLNFGHGFQFEAEGVRIERLGDVVIRIHRNTPDPVASPARKAPIKPAMNSQPGQVQFSWALGRQRIEYRIGEVLPKMLSLLSPTT